MLDGCRAKAYCGVGGGRSSRAVFCDCDFQCVGNFFKVHNETDSNIIKYTLRIACFCMGVNSVGIQSQMTHRYLTFQALILGSVNMTPVWTCYFSPLNQWDAINSIELKH